MALTGCYKEDKDKCPTHAQLIVNADWSARGVEESEPDGFTVHAAGKMASVMGSCCQFPHAIEPGSCHVNAHTTPAGVTFNGDIATVATTRANVITHMPGCLYTWSHHLTNIKKGKIYELDALMKQQVRRLVIELKSATGINNHVASAVATLDGVASSIDIVTEALDGSATVVVPFEANVPAGNLSALARLFGVNGTNTLTLDLVLANGETQTLEMDITSRLTNFNIDKHLKETITITIEEVSQVTGEITDWTVKGGYTGSVD